jgi:hypothetical protein
MILRLDLTVGLMAARGIVKPFIPVDYMMMTTLKLTETAVLVEVALVLIHYAKTLLDLINLISSIVIITLPSLTHVVIMIMSSLRLLSIVVLVDILLFILSNPSDMLAIWTLKIMVAIHVHGTQTIEICVEIMTLQLSSPA